MAPWNKISSSNLLKANPPKRFEKWTLRIMVLGALFWMIIFIWWFFGTSRLGSPVLYWPLTIVLCLKLLRMIYEWYHYLDISVPEKPALIRKFTVDMLTTACPGEPYSMILRTLKKMVAVKYPHTNYLCDEGNDPVLKKACDELGVIHVTRKVKYDAKAGNINNALKQATGEICIIMDPDHEPIPDFIHEVLPYFQDSNIGYVQVVQGYYNQKDGFVARAAAEQTYHFYGPMMMCMNSYNTSQAIGANCTFRRTALDSIGGHAAGLTEDMHTAMKLQAKGWKGLYVPEMLSRGLVPSSISGYYKQQLKWARGTFELFFEVLPGLFKDLSWRQRFHHLMSPLYYLSGVANLINILIPVFALFMGEFPWKVDIEDFLLFYSPLLVMTLLIRQYSQKWLVEESERGFHIRGGLLQLGTWWIYVLGFVYSIFRVKVPYIPTPKDDEPENNWKLVLPNMFAVILSASAIIYGLRNDLNPYSIFMATFAVINIIFLSYFSLIVQQKLISSIRSWVNGLIGISSSHRYKVLLWKIRHGIYYTLRETSVLFSALLVLFMFIYATREEYSKNNMIDGNIEKSIIKNTGGFYKGIYLPENDVKVSMKAVGEWEKTAGYKADIISFYQAWGPESLENFPDSILNIAIIEKGITPMITWEPWSSTFPEFKEDFNLATDRRVMTAITEGRFDNYIEAYCEKVKSLMGPIFLRFAHEPDNPQYPWSVSGANTPEEFIEAHRYIVNFFAEHGVTNVAWVWNPWNAITAEKYYPGNDFVDWVGITGLNYGLAAMDGKWKTFEEIYNPFRTKILKFGKPVMISEFGSTTYGGDQYTWLNQAYKDISEKFKEIKSATFFYTNKDKNWVTSWRPYNSNDYMDWTFYKDRCFKIFNSQNKQGSFNQIPLFKKGEKNTSNQIYNNRFFRNDSSGHQFIVNSKPFYIKGIVYNTGQDWQDGNIPLTKKHLLEDFSRIKKMGANTIRRYGKSIYDDNILSAANENGLKVIYGFWFDPKVDYYTDSLSLEQYLQEAENMVMQHQNDSSILAWSLGNETWGLLKHSFSQPYLTKVRKSYTLFIEKLAERIHLIDTLHPVLTAMEHTKELSGELHEFSTLAPAIDIAGINSYYIENIRELDSIAGKYYPGKPYIVSEFGPKGYWNPYLSKLKNDTILEEESDKGKAKYYKMQWKNFIEINKGHNIGGFAFCWQDRMEGTATWFGITDYKGRLKPVYYALIEAWTGQPQVTYINDFDIEWESDSIIPGSYQGFKVKMLNKNKNKNDYNYEWFLRKDNSMESFPGYIREFLDGNRISMKVPDSPGLYRLYLYVSDNNGNVSTISHPIPVKYTQTNKRNLIQ